MLELYEEQDVTSRLEEIRAVPALSISSSSSSPSASSAVYLQLERVA
jgi:hypothetical protein